MYIQIIDYVVVCIHLKLRCSGSLRGALVELKEGDNIEEVKRTDWHTIHNHDQHVTTYILQDAPRLLTCVKHGRTTLTDMSQTWTHHAYWRVSNMDAPCLLTCLKHGRTTLTDVSQTWTHHAYWRVSNSVGTNRDTTGIHYNPLSLIVCILNWIFSLIFFLSVIIFTFHFETWKLDILPTPKIY